eukprot:6185523-Pleurochrysis_carterae.AAC.3
MVTFGDTYPFAKYEYHSGDPIAWTSTVQLNADLAGSVHVVAPDYKSVAAAKQSGSDCCSDFLSKVFNGLPVVAECAARAQARLHCAAPDAPRTLGAEIRTFLRLGVPGAFMLGIE